MQQDKLLQSVARMALGALVILFIGGIVFYKERLLFADASFISFNILKWKMMYIQEHRYGSFITQWVLYAGTIFKLPARLVLFCYTISFNLFYLIAGVLLYRMRQYATVILMALYYLLIASATYFWTNNEIHQAIAWLFLLLGAALYLGQKKTSLFIVLPIFMALSFLTVFTHFIVLIPLAFLWVYLLLEKDRWPYNKKINALLTVLLAIIIVVKFIVVGAHSYDAEHLHNAGHLSFADIPRAYTSGVVIIFIKRSVTYYWIGYVAFAMGLYSLYKKKRWPLLLWTLLSFAGYLFLMGITYGPYGSEIALFHIESEWESLGIIMATPFVLSFLPDMKKPRATIFLSLIIAVRVVYIVAAAPSFLWRTHFKEEVLAQMRKKNITKLAIIRSRWLEEKNIVSESLPDESMLLSTMEGDEELLTFFLIDDTDKMTRQIISNPKITYATAEITKPNEWNFNYFLPDTTHPYQVMTFDSLMK